MSVQGTVKIPLKNVVPELNACVWISLLLEGMDDHDLCAPLKCIDIQWGECLELSLLAHQMAEVVMRVVTFHCNPRIYVCGECKLYYVCIMKRCTSHVQFGSRSFK